MKKRKRAAAFFLAAAVLSGLSGCGDAGNGPAAREPAGLVKTVSEARYPEEPVYKTSEERFEAEREKTVPENFRKAYGSFAVDSASAILKGEEGNAIYSPLGLYFSLAAAAGGAEGETRKEMLSLLGYPYIENLSADCKGAFEKLYHVTNEKNNKENEYGEYAPGARYRLEIANSLWADTGLEVKKTFADHVAQYFYADVYQADFSSPDTPKAMADWVQKRTNGRISPEPESLEGMVLSLKNTIYFYDEWMDRFLKEETKPDTFTLADKTEVTCDFMNRTYASAAFRSGANFTTSSVALKNGRVEFYLPDEGVDVRELVESPETLDAVLNGEDGEGFGEVVWKIPKFSYKGKLNLKNALAALGMERAFSGEDADFSALSDFSPLFLDQVTQECRIGLDENGVEAAAYTEIAWAGAALPKDRADMILNRPFLYVVKNKGVTVFVGICGNPAEGM